MKNIVIVSRHPAAIKFIQTWLASDGRLLDGYSPADVPIVEQATESDVQGKIVFGNLPMGLACKAACVYALEFAGSPPRGQEYSLDDMLSAGATLTPYKVCDDDGMTEVYSEGFEQGTFASSSFLGKYTVEMHAGVSS